MKASEIVARFLLRFAASGILPMHDHDSAMSKDAVKSQPTSALYLDCSQSIDTVEAILAFCVEQKWIVAPFGLSLGLGINQPTFEATQKGLDAGEKLLKADKQL